MGQSPNIDSLNCSHCGDPCSDQSYQEASLQFCCSGCQTVYQLLQDNGLGNFYSLDQDAGRSQLKSSKKDYSWLLKAELSRSFIQYQDEQHTRVQLELPDIHCTSCIWLLENLNRLHEGLTSVQVNFGLRRATILFQQQLINLQELSELLARIGYPPAYHQGETTTSFSPRKNRLLYQIGLAGFVFGNIMLFSFPEYLGLKIDLAGSQFERLFGYLNLILIIPVLLYSGQDYLRAAYTGLREKAITVDLPISLGILALFGRSAYEIISQTGPGYFDSLAGLLFFLLIGRWFQNQTFSRLSFDRDYRAYFPIAARKKNEEGNIEALSLEAIKPGDVLLIRPGDLIPVDGLLQTEQQVGIDYSFVTGEALPQMRKNKELLYAGGRATHQAFEIIATKVVEQSYLLQLWQDQDEAPIKTQQNLIDKASKYFTLAVLSIAFCTLVYWWSVDAGKAVYSATSVLIIACPCALALAIPFTYGAVIRVLGQYGFYLRSVQVIEELQNVQHFIFDKTGTLSLPQSTSLPLLKASWTEEEQSAILSICLQSKHPKSKALASYLLAGDIKPSIQDPTISEKVGQGISFNDYRIGQASFCQIANSDLFQGGQLYISRAGQVLAVFGALTSRLRKGWEVNLAGLKNKGVLHLLSGDHRPAESVWEAYIPAKNCHFEQSPFDKRQYVQERQVAGQAVCMLGDGLNDAGALKAADVGIAISEDQTSFSPASDVILAGNSFEQLAAFLQFIRTCRWVLYLGFAVAIIYNIIGLSFAIQGQLAPVIAAILMPLSSLSIVAIGLLGVYLIAQFYPFKK